MSDNNEVVIVGGGPVGLVIALMVARAGIRVKVLEANNEVIQSPRAMAYGPAAVHELERVGIAQECRDIGMEEIDYHADMRWIKINGEVTAQEAELAIPDHRYCRLNRRVHRQCKATQGRISPCHLWTT